MNQAALYHTQSLGQQIAGKELISLVSATKNQHIIDIGSGTGNLTYLLAEQIGSSGKILAIEPDHDRMCIAQNNKPSELKNITWYSGFFNEYDVPSNEKYHAAFSNYVFHWIPNQEEAVRKVYQLLVPGGKFAFCCVFSHPPIIEDLILLSAEAGCVLREKLHYRSKAAWLELFEKTGFQIVTESHVADYHFPDLQKLLLWWQATTHGLFSVSMIDKKQLLNLEEKYPGQINIYSNETIRVLLIKPSTN